MPTDESYAPPGVSGGHAGEGGEGGEGGGGVGGLRGGKGVWAHGPASKSSREGTCSSGMPMSIPSLTSLTWTTLSMAVSISATNSS